MGDAPSDDDPMARCLATCGGADVVCLEWFGGDVVCAARPPADAARSIEDQI